MCCYTYGVGWGALVLYRLLWQYQQYLSKTDMFQHACERVVTIHDIVMQSIASIGAPLS